jgi:hypothetical protein
MAALYLKSRLPLDNVVPTMKSLVLAMEATFVKIADLGVDPESFFNINTHSDFKVAETMLAPLVSSNALSLRPHEHKCSPRASIMHASFLAQY